MSMESYNMWSFVTGFFHLICFQDSPILWHVSILPNPLWVNNVPLHGDSTFCLSIHQLVNIGLFPLLGYDDAVVNICVTFLCHRQVFRSAESLGVELQGQI